MFSLPYFGAQSSQQKALNNKSQLAYAPNCIQSLPCRLYLISNNNYPTYFLKMPLQFVPNKKFQNYNLNSTQRFSHKKWHKMQTKHFWMVVSTWWLYQKPLNLIAPKQPHFKEFFSQMSLTKCIAVRTIYKFSCSESLRERWGKFSNHSESHYRLVSMVWGKFGKLRFNRYFLAVQNREALFANM